MRGKHIKVNQKINERGHLQRVGEGMETCLSKLCSGNQGLTELAGGEIISERNGREKEGW